MNNAVKPPRSREGLVVAASVLGALLVGGGLYLWQGRSSPADSVETASEASEATVPESKGSEESPTTTQTPYAVDPTTTTSGDETASTDHADCPEDAPAEVCSAARFVEAQRGRPFLEFPTVELVEPSDFESRLLADFDESADELSADGATMAALGLIPADSDLVEVFRESLSLGVVGFYDPESRELVIKGADLDLYAELVIVHELTHAFDDQYFDLDRPEADELEDDQAFGYLAAIEGNASRVEAAWRASLSDGERSELTSLEFGLLSPSEIERYLAIPPAVLELQIAPYTDGELFVDEVVDAEGEAGVDDLLMNPPRSSEQILHPERFFSAESVTKVDPEPAPGEVLDEGVLGELVIAAWLGSAAADGWAGDSFVTWDAGEDQKCVAVAIVADDQSELDQMAEAASGWASGRSDRQVEREGGRLVVSGCT